MGVAEFPGNCYLRACKANLFSEFAKRQALVWQLFFGASMDSVRWQQAVSHILPSRSVSCTTCQECIEIVGNPADITAPHTLFWLRVFFGRMRSRWAGALMETRIPVALRSPLYGLFAWAYLGNASVWCVGRNPYPFLCAIPYSVDSGFALRFCYKYA